MKMMLIYSGCRTKKFFFLFINLNGKDRKLTAQTFISFSLYLIYNYN